jgi:hypothetical protein
MRTNERIFQLVIALVAVALLPKPNWAQAHEHGVAEVGIALEGAGAQIEFTAPGSAIMSFEHEPKTAADKKKMSDAFGKFKANAGSMFAFDPQLNCAVKTLQIGIAEEHDHSAGGADHEHSSGQKAADGHDHDHADVRAIIDVKCKSPLKGSTLRFAVKNIFPEISTLRVQVVGNDFQTGAELKGSRNSIRLAR